MAQTQVCLGVVVGAHGVRGAVKVKSFTADPDAVAAYGPVATEDGARTWTIAVDGHARGVVVCRLSGVTDRTTAEGLKGVRLWVPRTALPAVDDADAEAKAGDDPGDDAETYYHADLIGLRVEDTDGRPLGTVRGIFDFGAGDVLDVTRTAGPPVMIPFTRQAVPVVDPAAGRLVVAPVAAGLSEAGADPDPDPDPDSDPNTDPGAGDLQDEDRAMRRAHA